MSRQDRVKRFVTGQNYRKVTPEVIENHKEIISSIKIVKAAHDFRSRTTALKQAFSGKSNADEKVRKEIVKEGR